MSRREPSWNFCQFSNSFPSIMKQRMVCWGTNYVVCLGLTSLSTIFQSYHYGVWLRQGAHFYSAASLKYHAPDTWHDTTPSHIILILGRPGLALPSKSWVPSEEQLVSFLTTLVYCGLGSNPWPPVPWIGHLPTELPGPVDKLYASTVNTI